MTPSFSDEELSDLDERLESLSTRRRLQWVYKTFPQDRAVMGTGFGASGVVLMHFLEAVQPGATVFYLDTDVLFPETYNLRDRLAARFDLDIVRVHPGLSLDEQTAHYGAELWNTDPDQCCFLRKVQPLRDYLGDKDAWLTAIRRDQSPTRAETDVLEWSPANEVAKVNPLADWTADDIWAYVDRHDLPYNPLHDEGYPSIGCMPCTEPVSNEADDPRAGRWAGSGKRECGLHLEPDGTD